MKCWKCHKSIKGESYCIRGGQVYCPICKQKDDAYYTVLKKVQEPEYNDEYEDSLDYLLKP